MAVERRIVEGERDLPSRQLQALAPRLARGERVLWLDAGNAFDAYGFSYAARRAGFDARAALARVDLARPFNLFQLETMVRLSVPARWRGEMVILSDPLPLFYDEDVRAADALRVLRDVTVGIRALPAPWLILTPTHHAPPGRESWLGRFRAWLE